MKVLEVDRISKQFGSVKAVNDVSFTIDEGIVFGLLGPNGAGKTTTIRMIMNIIIPDSGRIVVMGDPDPRTANDQIGYLPEERGLYRKMKVGHLLLYMADLKRMPRSDAKKEIDPWLERMDLMEWKHKKLEELSKGMQQKLQFIGTLLHRPKLLILDEPFGGLDPINQNLVKDILVELKKQGTTIIFSTHVMESAEKLCEEIFLINKGHQVIHGPLTEIKKTHGKQNIHVDYSGSDTFLENPKLVKKHNNYGNHAEVQLIEGADPQEFLKTAIKDASINRFEIMEPSLNEIFIETVEKETEEEMEE